MSNAPRHKSDFTRTHTDGLRYVLHSHGLTKEKGREIVALLKVYGHKAFRTMDKVFWIEKRGDA